ncbi:MAG: hypothetical protein Q9218_004846 [Villophora microphyllina]
MLLRTSFPLLLILPSLIQASALIQPRAPPAKPSTDQDDDDNPCPNYGACSVKGLQYWNDLTTTLANPDAKDRSDGLQLFQKYYGPEFDQSVPAWPNLEKSFADRQMNANNLDVWEVNSVDPVTNERDRAMAYYNVFGTGSGVLIAENNWRSMDQQKKLPWSEIMYQTWQLAEPHANALAAEDKAHPPGGPFKSLRAVVRHNIVNEGTRAVIEAAYNANGWKIGEDDAEQWRSWTEETSPNWFYGLLGTDNVKGVIWLLKDHAVELGRKEITTIWTRWDEVFPNIWWVHLRKWPVIHCYQL